MLAFVLATLLLQPSPAAGAASPSPAASPLPGPMLPVGGQVRRGPVPAGTTPLPVPSDAIVVRNSGSTNTAGYTLVISPDGHALVLQNGGSTEGTVGRAQVRWLFAKVRAAAPLDALPAAHCMRSASFGSSTTIEYGDATSPDISCGSSPALREIARTVGVIVTQLHVVTFPRRSLRLE